MPVPGILVVVLIFPLAVFVTRKFFDPTLVLTPDFEKVVRNGPFFTDLRNLKPISCHGSPVSTPDTYHSDHVSFEVDQIT